MRMEGLSIFKCLLHNSQAIESNWMSMQSSKDKTQKLHPEGELGAAEKEALVGHWRDQDPQEEGSVPIKP